MHNIFAQIPETLNNEVFEDLLKTDNVRIERIISKGHCSPEQGWYDQAEDEWVIVLEGAGKVAFEDGTEQLLQRGDFIHIPKHKKHRVLWTHPDSVTVWLAVFFDS